MYLYVRTYVCSSDVHSRMHGSGSTGGCRDMLCQHMLSHSLPRLYPSPPIAHLFPGLVVVERGFPILRDIKGQGGIFRADPVGDIIEAKSWVIPCEDDDGARAVAKFLKKQARKSGLKANVSSCFSFITLLPLVRYRETSVAAVSPPLSVAVCRLSFYARFFLFLFT